jgi:hypothetical protein
MTKQTALKILNPILFLLFMVQASSAIGVKLGSYALFRLAHKPVGFALIAIGLAHLILNWSWVKTALFGIKPKRPVAKAV